MTAYARRATPLLAHKYIGEARIDLPDWLQDYHHHTTDGFGNNQVGVSMTRELLIPSDDGSRTIVVGEWVVMENGKLYRFRDVEFQAAFAEIPDAPVIE